MIKGKLERCDKQRRHVASYESTQKPLRESYLV